MKYMVVETQLSYAVVLDEEGRFIKVANFQYEVGQTLTEIEEMRIPTSVSAKNYTHRLKYALVALAACLFIAISYQIRVIQLPHASIHMAINPAVRIDVNRKDQVVKIKGTNSDGVLLIEDYDYKKKDLNLVIDELVDKSITMGYLYEGGKLTLKLDSKDNNWVNLHTESIATHLQDYMKESIPVIIEINDKIYSSQKNTSNSDYSENTSKNTDYDGDSDYDDSDYETATPKETVTPNVKPSINPTTIPPVNTDYNDSGYDDSNYQEPVVAPAQVVAPPQVVAPSTNTSNNDSNYDDSDYDDSDYGDK